MSITEPSPGTTSASPESKVPEQAAPPPVVRGSRSPLPSASRTEHYRKRTVR